MLLYTLIFVFAVIALLALGARSFTALVELILLHGSKVEAQTQVLLQALTLLSRDKAPNTSSLPTENTPTMQDPPSSPLTGPTTETKSPNSS
jgi:hypothetical protein